jgi:hypothetical protein
MRSARTTWPGVERHVSSVPNVIVSPDVSVTTSCTSRAVVGP